MRRRMILAAGAAAVAACVGLATPAFASSASASSYAKVVTVDASGSQLVFAEKTTGGTFTANTGGTLYAQNKAGDRTKLSTFSASKPLQVNAGMLIQASATSVHWRNLVSGAEGTSAVASDEQVVTPAPTGWVTKQSVLDADPGLIGTHYSLAWTTTAGATTDLGHPFGADTINFTTKDGPTGLIADANSTTNGKGNSSLAFMSWSDPGHWKTLYQGVDGTDLFCAAPSSAAVACQNRATDDLKSRQGMGVYALDGSKVEWLATDRPTACQALNIATVGSGLIGVATTNAGSCDLGKVYRFGLDNSYSVSRRVYNVHGLSAGLGGILAGSASQKSIVSLSGVTATPEFIVTN